MQMNNNDDNNGHNNVNKSSDNHYNKFFVGKLHILLWILKISIPEDFSAIVSSLED